MLSWSSRSSISCNERLPLLLLLSLKREEEWEVQERRADDSRERRERDESTVR
jgi:hypothetical protein